MDKEELRKLLCGTSAQNKPQQRKVQREGGLQIACVKWFRLQYPAFSKLLFHPKNEADGAQGRKIAINAAAGVVAGVPDLILSLPAVTDKEQEHDYIHGLGIELKYGRTNNQSFHQKVFQEYWETAGYMYALCRSLEEFQDMVNSYMEQVPEITKDAIRTYHRKDEETEANKKLLKKLTGKNVKPKNI